MPKIKFECNFPVAHEQLLKQIAHARARGLPQITECPVHDRVLAVVGGGPSAADHLAELATYGDIWAINGACGWLESQGIESTLFALDPCDFLAPRVGGARKAIVSTRCHPDVFDAIKGADIAVFDILQDTDDGNGIWGSISAVMSTFHLAAIRGFRRACFYGFEGSFKQATHAYMDEKEMQDFKFVVECGGGRYLTAPDLYTQCLELSKLLRFTHERFTEKSGGLLRAFIAERMKIDIHAAMSMEPEHDIVAITRGLRDGLRRVAA